MATEFEKGFRDIFLAGVGAMAITGEKAKEVLKAEFPEYADIDVSMPDESNRRVGQSIAAASLTEI